MCIRDRDKIEQEKDKEEIREIFVSTNKPLEIRQISEEGGSFWQDLLKSWIPWVIGILGFVFGIYDRFIKQPDIGIKIISNGIGDSAFSGQDFDSETKEIIGLKLFHQLSISVLHKNLYYKDIEILIKFKNDNKIHKGILYNPRNDK